MNRLLLPVLVLIIGHLSSFGQTATPDEEGSLVKWMSLKEAMEKEEVQPRPIIMDFYTSWCGWCKHMMKTTYADPEIAQYINTNFYPVKFDAEGKDTIEYLGELYTPVSMAPRTAHPLAVKLLQNKLVYPTTLYLNNYDKKKKEFGFSMMAQGFLESKKIEPILIFTLENAFRNSGYDEFADAFNKAFFDPQTDERIKELTWEKPSEFFQAKDSTDKKTLILIHTDWCNACKVMKRASFDDSLTVNYLKEKFNLVDFNPELNDTLIYKGHYYINSHSPQMPFHQLALALCKNSLTLPTLVVLDENMNVKDAIPFYLNPQVLKNIAVFYGDDIYKNKSWNDFMTDINKK